MQLLNLLLLLSLLPGSRTATTGTTIPPEQRPLLSPQHHSHGNNQTPDGGGGVSAPFFASLERSARLVDITYCVGTTGISPPFSCASRCRDFPSLRLVRTWNTGVLLSDSCGYIAVDHGDDDGDGDGGGGGHGQEELGGRAASGSGNGKAIIVAFRGTYSITNTIVDLSTVPQEYVPYPAPGDGGGGDGDGDGDGAARCGNCTVHMGFMASWRNAREVVLPALRAAREKYPGYPVHLIGHSLGGAVAALAALELRLGLGWEDVMVTTFGEPRVGNKKLAEYTDRAFGLLQEGDQKDDAERLPYRRVTHVGDPVPLLPLTEWGYRSHAGEVYIEKSSLPPMPEDLRLCHGDDDPECMAGAEADGWLSWVVGLMKGELTPEELEALGVKQSSLPARLKLWQLFFAHRDYFWRLGLCLPGGDPVDWGREKYNMTLSGVSEIEDL